MIPLERFDAVLLDMNGTFMFGQDRFGPQEHYRDTYREAGGQALGPGEVQYAIDAAVAAMDALYRDPAHADAFPPSGASWRHCRRPAGCRRASGT